MEGALFKKVDTTALFCRPNKRSPDEPSETEVNADISSSQWRPFNLHNATMNFAPNFMFTLYTNLGPVKFKYAE
jgi:hypothetical protein